MPAKEIQFDYSKYGKPYLLHLKKPLNMLNDPLANQTFFFNLSHSHNYILIAISKNKRLGIDIEYCKSDIDFLNIAKEFCSANEYHQLLKLSLNQRLIRFYQYWTHKEALAKALGWGLSFPLKQIEINFLDHHSSDFNGHLNNSLVYDTIDNFVNHQSLMQSSVNFFNSGGDNFSAQIIWKIQNIPLGISYAAALAVESKEKTQNISFWTLES